MAHKNERPLKDQTNINEEKFDLRKKAQVAVFMAQKRIKGKKLVPHPTKSKTWIYV